MPDLDSCIPFPIDEATLNEVVTKAKDWALMHGAAMRSKVNFSEDSLQVTKYLHICHIVKNVYLHFLNYFKIDSFVTVCSIHSLAYIISAS